MKSLGMFLSKRFNFFLAWKMRLQQMVLIQNSINVIRSQGGKGQITIAVLQSGFSRLAHFSLWFQWLRFTSTLNSIVNQPLIENLWDPFFVKVVTGIIYIIEHTASSFWCACFSHLVTSSLYAISSSAPNETINHYPFCSYLACFKVQFF